MSGIARTELRDGYYLVFDKATGDHDIMAYDVDHDTWMAIADAEGFPHSDRFQVVRYLCNPHCAELIEPRQEGQAPAASLSAFYRALPSAEEVLP